MVTYWLLGYDNSKDHRMRNLLPPRKWSEISMSQMNIAEPRNGVAFKLIDSPESDGGGGGQESAKNVINVDQRNKYTIPQINHLDSPDYNAKSVVFDMYEGIQDDDISLSVDPFDDPEEAQTSNENNKQIITSL